MAADSDDSPNGEASTTKNPPILSSTKQRPLPATVEECTDEGEPSPHHASPAVSVAKKKRVRLPRPRPSSVQFPDDWAPHMARIATHNSMDETLWQGMHPSTQIPPPALNPNVNISPSTTPAHSNSQEWNQQTPSTDPLGFPPGDPVGPGNPNTFAPFSPLAQTASLMHPWAPGHEPPSSGHALVAEMLTGSFPGLHIKPMYRRFEELNHRMLLHLQDEISELEDKLRMVDAADTHFRTFPGGVYPASRRPDTLNSRMLHARKVDVLGQIGLKMERYNQILSSFRDIQTLPLPTVSEIEDYRSFLAVGKPIAEVETMFLDYPHDLASVSRDRIQSAWKPTTTKAPAPAPAPAPMNYNSSVGTLALGISMAVLIPILTFHSIPNFVGRMTVVTAISMGIGVLLLSSGMCSELFASRTTSDGFLCFAVYALVMAIIAWSFG